MVKSATYNLVDYWSTDEECSDNVAPSAKNKKDNHIVQESPHISERAIKKSKKEKKASRHEHRHSESSELKRNSKNEDIADTACSDTCASIAALDPIKVSERTRLRWASDQAATERREWNALFKPDSRERDRSLLIKPCLTAQSHAYHQHLYTLHLNAGVTSSTINSTMDSYVTTKLLYGRKMTNLLTSSRGIATTGPAVVKKLVPDAAACDTDSLAVFNKFMAGYSSMV